MAEELLAVFAVTLVGYVTWTGAGWIWRSIDGMRLLKVLGFLLVGLLVLAALTLMLAASLGPRDKTVAPALAFTLLIGGLCAYLLHTNWHSYGKWLAGTLVLGAIIACVAGLGRVASRDAGGVALWVLVVAVTAGATFALTKRASSDESGLSRFGAAVAAVVSFASSLLGLLGVGG